MALDITHLNEAQKQAVTYGDGPVMLVAGAGTGKTTVVTNRIAWLLAEGRVKPEQILAVTFTEKAAAEMEERVDKLLPLGYVDLWIHTFHAFCQRVLVEHALDIGLPNDFTLLDTTAAWMLVRENLSRFDLDYYKPLGNPTKFIHALLQHFSRCKDEGVYPEKYLEYAESLKLNADTASDQEAIGDEIKRTAEIAESYHVYQQLLLENNALDFGDLINYTLQLFQQRPKVLNRYRDNFRYILVDEFQDTNWAQYELIKLLASPRNNLMVVGDDDQSIYKFRGASFSNIILFKKDFPTSAEIYLVDNYRSGQVILDAAYAFIQLNNPDRLEVKLAGETGMLSKKLISHAPHPGEVTAIKYQTADDEVRGVISKIEELREQQPDFSWDDVAILVRANEQAQRFVRYFRSSRIPHQFMAAKGLYSQDVIMAILAYLRLLDNYHESEALYKIMTLPVWNIDGEDVIHLTHLASRKSWSLWHTLHQYHGEVELKKNSEQGIQRLLHVIQEHTQLARKADPSVLIYRFLEDSGYLEYLTREETFYTREQLLFLNQFYKKVRQWEEDNLGDSVKEFIEYIRLELEAGDAGKIQQDIEEGPETITISTIHSAKGLEYRYVFIVGLVHLRFPTRERRDPIELPEALIKDILPEGNAHLQEERRLMYVALTRAKEKVFITYAQDYGNATPKKPSQFVQELGFDTEVPFSEVTRELILPSHATDTTVALAKYKLPNKFSFTQIRAFENCPRQYFYAHIIQIPSAGKATFSFGQIMHAVLEKFFTIVKERSSQTQGQLFIDAPVAKQQAPVVSLDELLAMYEALWKEDWFYDEENKRKYYEHGKDLLKKFYVSLDNKIPVPVMLEQAFNFKIADARFRGVIDRIDAVETPEGTKWRLIDYKTGQPPKEGKLAFKDKEQLLLYQIAAQEVFGKEVHALTLQFLETNEQFDFLGSPDDLDKLRQHIGEIVDDIRESSFEPTPGFWCQSCDFRFICPAAQR